MIVDFEGHPGQAVSERRIKRQVLRDVAGMLCSFRYAADMALTRQMRAGPAWPQEERRHARSVGGLLAALGERGVP